MKAEIRRRMQKLRQNIDAQKNADLSKIISKKLESLKAVQSAENIMVYNAFKGEVNLREFLDFCIDKDKRVFMPRIVDRGTMQAAEYTRNCLMQCNAYGINEPLTNTVGCEALDVIIVPALAFDEKLFRLGYGGGYYDRFLKRADALKIGVCFDFQIVDRLPCEDHDIKMDMVISEKRTLGAAQ